MKFNFRSASRSANRLNLLSFVKEKKNRRIYVHADKCVDLLDSERSVDDIAFIYSNVYNMFFFSFLFPFDLLFMSKSCIRSRY